jgi:HEAT repeat protein
MAVTIQDVVRYLSPEEPDYEQAAQLGPDALPHLEILVEGPDSMLASKAASLAALIRDPRAIQVLQIAAESADESVRVAAATAVTHLPSDQGDTILALLVTDSNPEIRRIAIESIPPRVTPDLQNVLEMIALTDPYPFIRDLSAQALRRASENQ